MSRTVTALHPERRDRVRIDLDGEVWRTVPAAAVVAAGLRVGAALDRERARDLRRALRRANALDAAGRALGRRDRSAAELDSRLASRGVLPNEREAALEAMTRLGYVDDARLAENRARELAARGYGDAAIELDLEQRGVGGDDVAHALGALEPEPERARRLAAGGGGIPAKTARMLASKGFAPESIESAVGVLD